MARTRGFTLIELMAVIVIIGIMSAIAIPNFMASRYRAYEASLRANMHTVQITVEDFAVLAEGHYPGTIDTKIGEVLEGLGYPLPAGWQNMKPYESSIADGRRAPPFTDKSLIHPHEGFANPFRRSDNAINNSLGPPAVPPSGCTYYTGYDESGPKTSDGDIAIGYSIFGFGKTHNLVLILSSGH